MSDQLALTRIDTPDVYSPRENKLILLGTWCLARPLETDDLPDWVTIVPYHWDDREKFRRDREYLRGLLGRLEVSLADYLNCLHGTNHSLRFWRIIAGPWLFTFISIVFDRWEMVSLVHEAVKTGRVKVSLESERVLVPFDYNEFVENFIGDSWNAQLLTTVLNHRLAEELGHPGHGSSSLYDLSRGSRTRDPLPSPSIRAKQDRLSRPYARGTGLQSAGEALLVASLGRIPRRPKPTKKRNGSLADRPSFAERHFAPRTPFEVFVSRIISSEIPVAYCEGFRDVQSQSEQLWRRTPSVVCSGPGVYGDEVYKFGIAHAIERGSRFVQLQHGGFYGVAEASLNETHERMISDLFCSWGWSDSGGSEVVPLGMTKKRWRSSVSKTGDLLISLGSAPRYSYVANSTPVSSQISQVFRACAHLINGLSPTVRQATRVRTYPSNWGWGEREFFAQRFPDVALEDGVSSFGKSVRASRLNVATYNSTMMLETFSARIPTICLIEDSGLELRPEAEDYFLLLTDAGVLHRSADSAARRINEIWEDVHGWWTSPEVENAVSTFVRRYANDAGNRILAVRKVIRLLARS